MTQPHIVRRYENSEWETAVDEYGGGGGAASGGPLHADIAVTPAEFNDLVNTPKLLVAGVAGQYLVPILFKIVLPVATPFTDPNPMALSLVGGPTQWAGVNQSLAAAGPTYVIANMDGITVGAAGDADQPLTLVGYAPVNAGALASDATVFVNYWMIPV